MTWRRVVGGALTTLLTASVLVVTATSGSAREHKGPPVLSSGGQSSSGDSKSVSHDGCTFYAYSGRYGFACGSGDPRTVTQVLNGDPVPDCWDLVVTTADLPSYGYTATPGTTYSLHSCLTGPTDWKLPPRHQQWQISEQIIPITGGACVRPYVDATMTGKCIMSLTTNQAALFTTPNGGSVPPIVLTTHPAITVRTNVPVAFGDSALDNAGQPIGGRTATTTGDGGVQMWAVMTSFTINPDGVAAHSQICDGTVPLSITSTPANAPTACWWTYPKSSEGLTRHPGYDDNTYPFVAQAAWTVYYNDGGGQQVLAQFTKVDIVNLPVLDVQSLNIN